MAGENSENRLELPGRSLELDADGFLIDSTQWDDAVAAALAAATGVGQLSDDHWRVIRFLRAYWESHGVAPMIRVLCRQTGLTLDEIYDLFPQGPSRGACKVAGLPKPDGCV